MFTGIVHSIGVVRAVEAFGGAHGDRRIAVECPALAPQRRAPGDSISVSGVCLTVTGQAAHGFEADVSGETLSLTTLDRARPGARVNLEPALRLDAGLGGHLVSGHVDGTARLEERVEEARSVRMRFSYPPALAGFIAVKGSVCADGVSLTVNDVSPSRFGVNVIPHTLEVTTLDRIEPGDEVNLEVDLVARYLDRLLQARVLDPESEKR